MIYETMQDRADQARLQAAARRSLTLICIIGIALFAGVMIGRGIEKAAYDATHQEQMQ